MLEKNSFKQVDGIRVLQTGGTVGTQLVQTNYVEGLMSKEQAEALAYLNQATRGSGRGNINVELRGGHIGDQRVSEMSYINKGVK